MLPGKPSHLFYVFIAWPMMVITIVCKCLKILMNQWMRTEAMKSCMILLKVIQGLAETGFQLRSSVSVYDLNIMPEKVVNHQMSLLATMCHFSYLPFFPHNFECFISVYSLYWLHNFTNCFCYNYFRLPIAGIWVQFRSYLTAHN